MRGSATRCAIGAIRPDCPNAPLTECKAGATVAAENGAIAHQLMAIFGWDTLKQAEVYTKAVDQKGLAESSMHLIEAQKQSGTKSGPTLEASGTFAEKAQ
jgi:hypothetical protein